MKPKKIIERFKLIASGYHTLSKKQVVKTINAFLDRLMETNEPVDHQEILATIYLAPNIHLLVGDVLQAIYWYAHNYEDTSSSLFSILFKVEKLYDPEPLEVGNKFYLGLCEVEKGDIFIVNAYERNVFTTYVRAKNAEAVEKAHENEKFDPWRGKAYLDDTWIEVKQNERKLKYEEVIIIE